MIRMRLLILSLLLLSTSLFAQKDIQKLSQELGLYGGEKATVQWVRIFSSPRHLKRYKLDTLDQETLARLRDYLIAHAADSEQPIVPGL